MVKAKMLSYNVARDTVTVNVLKMKVRQVFCQPKSKTFKLSHPKSV